MNSWNPSAQYNKVAEANRQYYAKTAKMYDATETCVTDQQVQQMLEADIDHILDLLSVSRKELKALDACGGSGNIALKLLKRGINVTLSDISSSQLDIFQQKCATQGFVAKVICGEIGQCFLQDNNLYDLIVFSSALHHLEDIEGVLGLAYEHLRPGGLLFTVFDPTAKSNYKTITKIVLWLDYIAFKIINQSEDFPAAVKRRLNRIRVGYTQNNKESKKTIAIGEETLGVLAEYHVEQGINDFALIDQLKQLGYQVVWHERYPGGRYTITQSIVRQAHDATQFKLLLKKPE